MGYVGEKPALGYESRDHPLSPEPQPWAPGIQHIMGPLALSDPLHVILTVSPKAEYVIGEPLWHPERVPSTSFTSPDIPQATCSYQPLDGWVSKNPLCQVTAEH